jgi:hypothetical protein
VGEADSPQTLDASVAGLAGVLSLPEASPKEQSVQTDAVLGWLKGRERWLLIADNADTDEAARALRDRFGPHLGGHVLAARVPFSLFAFSASGFVVSQQE